MSLNLTKEYGKQLNDVVCPVCGVKGKLYFYNYSRIYALTKTTVCDCCGTAYSLLQTNTEGNRIVGGIRCGKWKRDLIPNISYAGYRGTEYNETDPYFVSLAEPISFGEQIDLT